MKRSPLIILFITIFLDLLGFGLILPLLPIYIKAYGGQPWVGGMLMSSFSVMQFIFTPIWGKLSDRVGRRPLILLSLIGSAISYLFFGAAPTLTILFISRVASGILSSASLPTAQAYIADSTTPEKRSGGMALIGAAFGLGFAMGPVISGIVSQHPVFGITPLAMPAYAAAALCAVNFVFALFLLPESLKDRSNARKIDLSELLNVFPSIARYMRDPVAGPPLTVFAFTTFAFTAVESSLSWLVILRFRALIVKNASELWNKAHPEQLYSILSPEQQKQLIIQSQTATSTRLFTIVGITILFAQIAVMSGLARKVGETNMVKLGTILLTCSLVGIAISDNIIVIYIVSGLIAVGSGMLNPSLSALITHAAKKQNQGEISGVQQGLGSLARILAPAINNKLVEYNVGGIAGGIPFFSSALLMGSAFLLALRLKPFVRMKELEVETEIILEAE